MLRGWHLWLFCWECGLFPRGHGPGLRLGVRQKRRNEGRITLLYTNPGLPPGFVKPREKE